jgi:hypothetical protein
MAVVDKVYADPCKTAGGPRPVAPSVDALVTALSRVAHIRLTALANATIGGARGKTFRFGGASTLQTLNCGSMLKFATHVENGKDIDIAIFPGETDQFWAVDAAGTTVLIAITDNKVAAVQPVLNSVSFVASPG